MGEASAAVKACDQIAQGNGCALTQIEGIEIYGYCKNSNTDFCCHVQTTVIYPGQADASR